jgi:hypothetical protein
MAHPNNTLSVKLTLSSTSLSYNTERSEHDDDMRGEPRDMINLKAVM